MDKQGSKGLRIGVKKGGCAGMEYTMDYVQDVNPLDEVVEQDGARVLIAPMAQMFLIGTEIDYEVDLLQAGLVLRRDYLHLSRALMALAGSYGTLYEGDSRKLLFTDLAKVALRLPYTMGRDVLRQELRDVSWLPLLKRRPPPEPKVPVPMMTPVLRHAGPPPGVLSVDA
mgnify:CR=1 FL=1